MRRRKIDYHEFEETIEDEFPNLSHVASASECTGLTHRTPVNSEEWRNLQELSSMAIPPAPGGDRDAHLAVGTPLDAR